jgi:hypothetical protein
MNGRTGRHVFEESLGSSQKEGAQTKYSEFKGKELAEDA